MIYKTKKPYFKTSIYTFMALTLLTCSCSQKKQDTLSASQKKQDTLSAHGFTKISDSPKVYVCEHFLSDKECDHLIEMARPSLYRSMVINPDGPNTTLDERRTSSGTFFSATPEDETLKTIQTKVSLVTKIPEKNGEAIQLLHYGVGGEYQPHFDYFDPETPGGLIHFNRGGQRVATFMVYLHTTEAGGETIFPKANIKIAPEKGKAVLFYNVNEEDQPDPMSLHGGAPVVQGEKWLITRWLREEEFH